MTTKNNKQRMLSFCPAFCNSPYFSLFGCKRESFTLRANIVNRLCRGFETNSGRQGFLRIFPLRWGKLAKITPFMTGYAADSRSEPGMTMKLARKGGGAGTESTNLDLRGLK